MNGKEALIALASGEEVEYDYGGSWESVKGNQILITALTEDKFDFRLKQRTINLNGIEVPAPFEPKEDCRVFILNNGRTEGYSSYRYDVGVDDTNKFFGVWRTEEEIKQVVEALRSVFK